MVNVILDNNFLNSLFFTKGLKKYFLIYSNEQ